MNLEPFYDQLFVQPLEGKNRFLNMYFYDDYRSRFIKNIDTGKRTRLRRRFTKQEADSLIEGLFHGGPKGLRYIWSPFNPDEAIDKFLYGAGGRPQKRNRGRVSRNWIQKAIKRPGEFTEKALEQGMSAQQFARKVKAHPDDYDTRTKRQANLALTLGKMARRRRR